MLGGLLSDGFRSKRRFEKHLLTFNVILEKTLAMDQPLWILVWILQFVIDNVGQLLGQWKTASSLPLQPACDKGVISAHGFFLSKI